MDTLKQRKLQGKISMLIDKYEAKRLVAKGLFEPMLLTELLHEFQDIEDILYE